MSLQIGDKLPPGHFLKMTDHGPAPVDIEGYFSNRKIVLFSVPGAFTPTCSNSHLPGYIKHVDNFREAGIDAIACTAVNDSFVMHAWGLSANAGNIDMLADGNGSFVRSLGLEMDSTAFEMGHRGRRFALVADNGTVTQLFVEAPGEYHISSAEHVLSALAK